MTQHDLEKFQDLISKKALVHLATMLPDNSPHSVPVWGSTDGEFVYCNTVVGSQKDKNLQERKKVALSIVDPGNPFNSVMLRGEIIDRITGPEAMSHIDEMSMNYLGVPFRVREQKRVKYKIMVGKVTSFKRPKSTSTV